MIRVVLLVLILIAVSTSTAWAQNAETPDEPVDHAAHHPALNAVVETEEATTVPNEMPHTWQNMMSMMRGMNRMMTSHVASMPPMMAHMMSMMGAMGHMHMGQADISHHRMPDNMMGSDAPSTGCINAHGEA